MDRLPFVPDIRSHMRCLFRQANSGGHFDSDRLYEGAECGRFPVKPAARAKIVSVKKEDSDCARWSDSERLDEHGCIMFVAGSAVDV